MISISIFQRLSKIQLSKIQQRWGCQNSVLRVQKNIFVLIFFERWSCLRGIGQQADKKVYMVREWQTLRRKMILVFHICYQVIAALLVLARKNSEGQVHYHSNAYYGQPAVSPQPPMTTVPNIYSNHPQSAPPYSSDVPEKYWKPMTWRPKFEWINRFHMFYCRGRASSGFVRLTRQQLNQYKKII